MNEKFRQFASSAAEAAVSMTRGNYFNSKERGENKELKEELNSDSSLVRREAVRKVIAGMTVGNDVSELFPDILRCLQSRDLETKRLVYLYLVNYAHGQPDLALLAVNTFVRDSEDRNPLVRSLSLRTMSSLQIPNIVDYIDDPLRRALKDGNPMVRRTAAICIGKLHDNCREYYDDMMLSEALASLVSDSDPFVVSNALAVYEECGIQVPLDPQLIARLSVIVDKTGEWGISSIMNVFLQFCDRASPEQAGIILKRILPFLSHSNQSAAISAIRAIVNYLMRFPEYTASYDRRISACFATLLSPNTPPEPTFIILKLLEGLVRQIPSAAPPLKSIYVYYNDPPFVRRAKLALLLHMATRETILEILSELSEYAKDIDLTFAEAAVGCLGSLAVRFSASDPNIRLIILQLLTELCKTGLGHLFQAAVIALRSVYDPEVDYNLNVSVPVLGCFLNDQTILESPTSRAAVLWLASRIPIFRDDHNSISTLTTFSFAGESLSVQFALLDCSYFYHRRLVLDGDTRIDPMKHFLSDCIERAEQSKESIDLNERAVLYRRLLELDFPLQLPANSVYTDARAGPVPDWFICELGRISTIYQEPISVEPSTERTTTIARTATGAGTPVISDYMTEYTV